MVLTGSPNPADMWDILIRKWLGWMNYVFAVIAIST